VKLRRLGKRNLEVSVIGFGASPLGNVFGNLTTAESVRAVESAIENGINFFDVSPYYGLTLAEQRLGEALDGKRTAIVLATKCGRYGADHFDFSAKTVIREFEQSLRRLKTDYVDLLQAHDIEFGDIDQIVHETVPAMRTLQQHGKVRYIGLTGYWPGLLGHVAAATEVDCVLNYCHANLFVDDANVELVPFARRSGVGLLNASPLHMGLLGGKPVPDWHPSPPNVREAALQVRGMCRQYGIDPGTLALHFCLNHADMASTFVGISSAPEVVAAVAALDLKPPEDLMQSIRRIIAPVHNAVWPSGLDENRS
jgi:L-galactose dehydrogenase